MMKNGSEFSRGELVLLGVWVIGALSTFAAVVYMAFHFITKS